MWKIDEFELNPGEKRQVTFHPSGMDYEIPATLLCGAGEGMTMLVTAQIHSGEYNGSAAVMRLAAKLDPAKLKGNVILMHCVNTSGFWQKKSRYVPEDHVNLNADYPGDANGTTGQRIAAWFVQEIFPKVNFIADLHGGNDNEILSPCVFFPRNEKVTEVSLAAARALNTRYLLASSNSVGEYGYAANYMGIPGLILERGYGLLLREEWIQGHADSIALLLDHFGMYKLTRKIRPVKEIIYRRSEYLQADCRGVWQPAVTVEQKVEKGALLGSVTDFWGNVKKSYYAVDDAVILYYTAGMCVWEGDDLVAYGIEASAEE